MNSCTFFGHSEEPPCRHCGEQHDPAEEMNPRVRTLLIAFLVIAIYLVSPSMIKGIIFGYSIMMAIQLKLEERA